jgi:hypothetical protein
VYRDNVLLLTATDNTITTSAIQAFHVGQCATPNSYAFDNLYYSGDPSAPTTVVISTTGAYTSQLINVGSQISTWGPVTISETLGGATSRYEIGSTASASTSSITNWTSISNGQTPTISTNTYVAFRVFFNAAGTLGGDAVWRLNFATATANTAEFITAWNEGSQAPAPVATVYDRRYWLSYTTVTASSPILDSVAVFQRNQGWTFLQGVYAASFTIWQDFLYFGNSNDNGYAYKFDVGTNDDGEPITSIIQTKSYDMGQPHREKAFRNLYVKYAGNASYTGGFTVQAGVDEMDVSSIGSASLNEGTGSVQAKFPLGFSASIPQYGRQMQFRLEKTSAGDKLKLYDFVFEYEIKEAR